MRLLPLAAVLLLLPALAPGSVAETCSFTSRSASVIPSTNYWVSVDRSSCQTGSGAVYHREGFLLTEGDPSTIDHVTLVAITYYSTRTTPGDGSAYATDAASLHYRQQSVNASLTDQRTANGFTTCEGKLVYSNPPQTTTLTTGRLNACPPPELTYT